MKVFAIVGRLKKLLAANKKFSSSRYWENRYRTGGTSGPGSYGALREFKASVLNEFVTTHQVTSVIEFGCGDGSQLGLAKYPNYTGYDVSRIAVKTCLEKYKQDPTKKFFLVSDYDDRKADLALSLDVLFHLTEDGIFAEYMRRLFDSSSRFVVIYSSNQEVSIGPKAVHVRHRHFTAWVDENISSQWQLVKTIPNPYSYNGDYTTTSFSDFYIFERRRTDVR